MRKFLATASLLAAFGTPAAAQEFVTQPGALVCGSPFQLKEAQSAGNDPKWLESLGCTIARAGISATWIDENSLGIKLRLHPLTSADVTVWGRSRYEFMPPAPPKPSTPAPPPQPSTAVPSTDPFFKSLQQTITGAGYECDHVAGYASTGAERTVTCKIAGANAFFRIAMRDGATSVQRIEWRR